MKDKFNPNIQYRCTIIRGKAQKELDNLLPAYSSIIADICPNDKQSFNEQFNEKLSVLFYEEDYIHLNEAHQKTVRNHVTEIAGKLFGLYFEKNGLIYQSPSCNKLLEDNDQPAFFKNLCLNFQFPNGTQKTTTLLDRIKNKIKFKPFHFILALLKLAKEKKFPIHKDDIAYYVLNAKEVLQGKVSPEEVLEVIQNDKLNDIIKKVPSGSKHTQHIREQINLLILANLIVIKENVVLLNELEREVIDIFIERLNLPLEFDIYKYDLTSEQEISQMYTEWSEYFGHISVTNPKKLETNLIKNDALKKNTQTLELGDKGEEYVFHLEIERVQRSHPRLVNKIQLLGKIKGLGYDVLSVEAEENKDDPEFARFIEVKSTTRVTEPDMNDDNWRDIIELTRKEWVAAKQYQNAYNIYRVYFTPYKVVVRKINNPFNKNENNIIQVIPTKYRMDFNSKSIDLEY